jgi:RNA polymerase sigma-70 factor (family 1)
MSYQLLADDMLLKLLRASDEEAYRQIYLRYWKPSYITAYKKVHVKEVAEELVQNIFLGIWEKRDSSNIEQLSAYLNTAVKYQVLNYIKSCIIKERHAFSTKGQTNNLSEEGDSMLIIHELSEAINDAINHLPEKSRLIFRLSRFENKSINEIAQTLCISEKVVEYHITKSLRFLRLQLKEFIVVDLILLNIRHFH